MYSNNITQHKDLISFICLHVCVTYEHYAKPLHFFRWLCNIKKQHNNFYELWENTQHKKKN